eukprot:1768665-Rhodomonas_salina.1
MDNVYLVGPLELALAAASEAADSMREDLDLEINVEESWVHVPAWAEADRAPAAYAEALEAFPALANLPLRLAGCK